MALRIERVVTSGVFSLDGQDFDVDNNVWLVGDDSEVVVIDAAHDAQPILDGVAGRRVTAIVCTHAHNDHINAAPAFAAASRGSSAGLRRPSYAPGTATTRRSATRRSAASADSGHVGSGYSPTLRRRVACGASEPRRRTMFVQVIHGKVKDADLLARQT